MDLIDIEEYARYLEELEELGDDELFFYDYGDHGYLDVFDDDDVTDYDSEYSEFEFDNYCPSIVDYSDFDDDSDFEDDDFYQNDYPNPELDELLEILRDFELPELDPHIDFSDLVEIDAIRY